MPQIGVGVGIGRRRRRGSGVGVQPILIGRQSGIDYGTTGDWFVDQSRPTSGDGLSLATAFKTITEAVTAASRGQRIKVATGTYRETATLTGKGGASPASPLRIEPYGTAEPIITGGEPLTGWALCSAGDATDVGSNWGSIYKVTVAASSFVGANPRAAFPCEAGVPLVPCMWRVPNPARPQFAETPEDWYSATSVQITGTYPSATINSFTRLSLAAAYTQAQIERCDIWFRGQANFCYRSPITSFNPATGVITPTRQDRLYELEDRFALMNLLPEMRPGEWGWKDAGGGNTTLYIWPNNAANVAAGIEYTARGRGVFVDQESNVAIRGLTVQQIADASDDTQSANGNYAIVNMGLTKKTGFLVENCLIQNCYRGYFSNFGAVNASSCDNITVKNITIRNIIGHSGVNLGGPDASGALSTTIWADRNHCEDIERTGVRFAGAENAVASFNKYSGTSSAAHANMTNATGKSHNILFHANNFSGGINGYCPFQQASRVHYTANLIAAASDARAIVDQNSAAGTPISRAAELGISGDGAVLCNTISPHQVALTNPGSITLGKAAYPEVTFILHNNIMPGVLPNAAITANSYNVVTGVGATLGANDTATTHGAVFGDAASGDVSIKAGSPSRTHVTKSLTAEIAVIKSRFPWFSDIDLDMHGRTINWASPPVGCAVNQDDIQPVRPVAIHQGPNTASIRPSVSGTPQQGGTLTVSGGYVRGAPFVAFAWQWQKSVNSGVSWSDISGATALTYTIQPGDVGAVIRCRMTSGASVSYTAPTATVVSGYAIDNPAVLAGSTSDYVSSSASATARQMTFPSSGSLTTNGRTLFLAVPCRQNNATGTVWTVATIGAAGRAFGTGTALTLIETVIRAPSTVSIFMLTGLAAGTYTVQLQNAAGSEAYNIRCNVFEMGGVVSAGTPGTTAGGTGVVTLTPTVTTTAANSMVLHTLIRGSGVADDATVTGATEFLETDSGGTNAGNDVKLVLAYEAAATTGAYAGTFTWSVAVSASARSVELKS